MSCLLARNTQILSVILYTLQHQSLPLSTFPSTTAGSSEGASPTAHQQAAVLSGTNLRSEILRRGAQRRVDGRTEGWFECQAEGPILEKAGQLCMGQSW